MRFIVFVKATKNSEAGVMPSQELLAAMMKYNEELLQAGVMLGGGGASPEFEGRPREVFGEPADRHRRTVCRDERTRRRLLALAVHIERRGHRVGQALSSSDAGRRI
jgi:hypothetical protein